MTALRSALFILIGLLVLGVGSVAVSQQGQPSRASAMGFPDTPYNRNTAHAQDRGCDACHADHLAADVSRLYVPRGQPEQHGIFVTSYDIPMRVEDCLPCHAGSFGAAIHASHLHSAGFISLRGGCDSCHVLSNGKFVLYDDETRYQVLNGVTRIPTPDFSRD